MTSKTIGCYQRKNCTDEYVRKKKTVRELSCTPMLPNDQAEPQADCDSNSFHKAGEVGRWSPCPFQVRMEASTQSSTQSVIGHRQPDCRKEHALLTDSINISGQMSH